MRASEKSNVLMKNMVKKTHRKKLINGTTSVNASNTATTATDTIKTLIYGDPICVTFDELKKNESPSILYHSPISLTQDSLENKSYNFEGYLAIEPYDALWPTQETAVDFIISRESDDLGVGCKGLLLCDQMGMGKSLAALYAILKQNKISYHQSARMNMEIDGNNIGASTYAMKKAMEMPNLLLGLVQQTADSGKQSLSTKIPESIQTIDLETIKSKVKIIDLIA